MSQVKIESHCACKKKFGQLVGVAAVVFMVLLANAALATTADQRSQQVSGCFGTQVLEAANECFGATGSEKQTSLVEYSNSIGFADDASDQSYTQAGQQQQQKIEYWKNEEKKAEEEIEFCEEMRQKSIKEGSYVNANIWLGRKFDAIKKRDHAREEIYKILSGRG